MENLGVVSLAFRCFGGFWLLCFGFCKEFFDFLVASSFHMDGDAVVFGHSRGNAVHAMGKAGFFVFAQNNGMQCEMRRAAAFMGRGSTMARKTHRMGRKNKRINDPNKGSLSKKASFGKVLYSWLIQA